MTDRMRPISRRGMLTGFGVAGGAALLSTRAGAATAASADRPGLAGRPTDSSSSHSIASPPVAGVSYRFAYWSDFLPEVSLDEGRQWSSGVYTNSGSDYLGTSFEVPPGAVLYDVEWYLSNKTTAQAHTNTWNPGAASFSTAILDQFIPADNGIHTHRDVVPARAGGPFPLGTMLRCALYTPTDGSVLLNGVRVGFRQAPLHPVLLPTPQRVYDSYGHGGALADGQTRTVGLSSVLPAGSNGVLAVVTATRTKHSGYLTAHAPGTTPPTASVSWSDSDQTVSCQVTSAVSRARTVALTCTGGAAHFTVDVVGYLV